MRHGHVHLPSGRHRLRMVDGSPPVVVKRGHAASIAREARGLQLAQAAPCAARFAGAAPGELRTLLVDGAPRTARAIGPGDAATLGRALRQAHEVRRTRSGGLPSWRSRARDLAAYRRRRTADALAASGPDAPLAARVAESLPPLPPLPPAPDLPFRLLHGDLTLDNVVWDPAPRLVDWEFWRMGDPAEDLAYLAEVNGLSAPLVDAVLDGYGAPDVAARVDGWRALCALDAGFWYRDAGEASRARRLLRRASTLARDPTAG